MLTGCAPGRHRGLRQKVYRVGRQNLYGVGAATMLDQIARADGHARDRAKNREECDGTARAYGWTVAKAASGPALPEFERWTISKLRSS